MKFSRDTWLAIGLFLLLVLVTAAAAARQSRSEEIPYLSTSSAPGGALALKLWLNELGIDTVDSPLSTFVPPQNADLILMLQPGFPITESEWRLLDQWVDKGGTLLLAGSTLQFYQAVGHYEFDILLLDESPEELTPQTPLFSSPPLAAPAPISPDYYLSSQLDGYVTHLAVRDLPVTVSFEQGQGRVVLSTIPDPFSNIGLKDDANAELVLNLLALSARKPETAWLDDWHHGIQGAAILGPGQWLRNTSPGHAILFVIGVIFVALFMRGSGFGRPVPLPHEIKRRGPLEHVTAIANLNRKAGHRAAVLQQYHHYLKRHLGRRYRLDPSLPDVDYVRQLSQLNPGLDVSALAELLKRLSHQNPAESDIIKLAAETARWMER
ncbi:MAG: DUF4350 domain-containing protein [Chloroflexota bacterium]